VGPFSLAKNKSDEKCQLVDCVDKIMDIFYSRLEDLPVDLLSPFADTIIKGVNALVSVTQKRIFIPVSIWMAELINEPIKSQIASVINTFIDSASLEDLKFVFNNIGVKDDKEEVIQTYNDALKQRATHDQQVFEYLYDIASKDIRKEWFVELIRVDHQRALKKLEQLDYRVDDRKSVVSAIFTRMNMLPQIMQRKELLFACNKMKCANDAELKGRFAESIKALLRDTTPDPQKMGMELLQEATYLSQTHKRDIAIDTIEYLSSLPPATAYQPSSAKSVLLAWPLLTSPPRGKLLYYVFDILIRRGSTVQSIQLGLNIMSQIEPKLLYEDYSKYFDDLLNRAETETDPNIKSLLINGLNGLDSKELNDRNRNFWQRVRRLSSA